MTSFDKTNVIVSGSRSAMGEYANYTTVIPKPTLVGGKMLLTQSMVSKPNTKYVIKWNFELAEDITIPANCVLEFDGGSISGEYTITGANTGIQAGLVKIFGTDIALAGTWNIAWAYPEWFGAKGDATTDDTIALQKVVNFVRGDRSLKVIRLSKAYAVRTIEIDSFGVHISGAKKESNVGLYGIEQNAPVFHITGMARGFVFENFTITGTVSGVIGIYAEAICTEINTAGMWYSRFESIFFNNCYTAIKLRAIDSDTPNVGHDVANQVLSFSNIRTNNIAYADIHVTGQLGQTSFNDCMFERGTRQCYILIDGDSLTNDNFYANFNDCSFIENPSISVIYADSPQHGVVKFNNCWFEDISNPFIRAKMPSSFEFNNCFWTRCIGTNFITDSGSSITVDIKGGCPFGSEYQNAGDTNSMNATCYSVRCDNNLIKSFYRLDTAIKEVGEFVEVLAKYKMTTLERVHNAIRYNRTYSVYLGKHSEYNYSITGIKDGDNFIGYFTLGKTYLFEYKLGKIFCISNTILSGTSQDRTEVIDTSLISIGFKFFDSTLNKELWWNGSSWVDNKGFSPALTKGTYANRPVGIHTEGDVTVGDLDRTKDIGFEYFDTDYGFKVFASAIAVDGTVIWDSPNFDSEVGVAVWSDNKMFFYPMNEAINHINEALGVYVRSDNALLIVAKGGSDYKKWNTTNVAGGTSYKSNLITALDDNDGVTNTTTIINTLGNTAEAATYCNGYEPSNVPAEPGSNWASKGLGIGKWHLGSVGEFSVINKKIDAVNKMLAMIGGTPLFVSLNDAKIYWTSTEYNAERTWAIDILTNNPEHPNKTGNYNVRPICRYNIP